VRFVKKKKLHFAKVDKLKQPLLGNPNNRHCQQLCQGTEWVWDNFLKKGGRPAGSWNGTHGPVKREGEETLQKRRNCRLLFQVG
jgi:hypothetical protein